MPISPMPGEAGFGGHVFLGWAESSFWVFSQFWLFVFVWVWRFFTTPQDRLRGRLLFWNGLRCICGCGVAAEVSCTRNMGAMLNWARCGVAAAHAMSGKNLCFYTQENSGKLTKHPRVVVRGCIFVQFIQFAVSFCFIHICIRVRLGCFCINYKKDAG